MKKTMITLVLVLAVFSICCAEEVSLSISCTIPAIPGVNAPAENTASPATPAAQAQELRQAQIEQALAQASNVQAMLVAQTMSGATMVQTIYSR